MTSSEGHAEATADRLLDDLQHAVLRKLDEDALVLPALPAVVVKAMGMLRAGDADLRAVARVIEPDPVATARILRLANSAAFRSAQPISTLALAIARIGARETASVLIELSAHRVFASHDPAINRACRLLWEHSVATGLLARSIAGQVDWAGTSAGSDAPETAYVGGLLHDVGKPVLAGLLLEAEKRLRGKQTPGWLTLDRWMRVVSASHRRVGLALAKAWDLPYDVVAAIEGAATYDGEDGMTVGNVVVLANALAKRERLYAGTVDLNVVEAEIEHGRTLFLLSSDTIAKLCEGLADRVKLRLT